MPKCEAHTDSSALAVARRWRQQGVQQTLSSASAAADTPSPFDGRRAVPPHRTARTSRAPARCPS
eukprot:4176935-Prymnesium_polylepis.1